MNVLQEANNILDDDILLELNKINNMSVKRRISHELVNLKKNKAYIHVEYVECKNIYKNSNSNISNNINFHFIITIMLESDTNIYKFEIPSDYPFRGPKKITINYKPYINYLKIQSNKTMKELQLYKGIGCLCCNSISYASKWNLSTNIVSCIDEFKLFMQYRRDIVNKIIVEKIKNKYLLNDINLLEWLL